MIGEHHYAKVHRCTPPRVCTGWTNCIKRHMPVLSRLTLKTELLRNKVAVLLICSGCLVMKYDGYKSYNFGGTQ